MKSTSLVVMVSLLLSFVLVTGCGRKTAPVYTEKQTVNSAEEGKSKE